MPIGAQPPQQNQNNAVPAGGSQEQPGQPPLFPGGELPDAFHKERQKLKDEGITFSLHELSEVWASVIGGGRQGVSYNGLTIAKLDLDLDALFGWKGGEFLTSAFDIHGHGPSRALVGNQQLVSNVEGTPSVKLYDLWLDQTLFEGKISVRAGQEGANDEMMVTAYGGLFLNSSFGFPGMPAADLPSGGPNYPLASPFARALYSPTDKITLVGAAYTDDPAPPGSGDPQARDRNGTAFRLNDHTLGIAELWYTPDSKSPPDLPTTYKLGAWYATGNFADRRLDSAGRLLANPTSTGRALNHAGDWAIYGIVDQMVWQQPGADDDGIGVFAMVMSGPSNRNLSNLYAEAGMNWRGPFKQRKDDVFGLAAAYLGISPAARQFGNDLVAFGQTSAGYASNETVIEATYQAPLTDWLTLQPDVQYVINPGAGVPTNFGNTSLPNAVVIGMRVTIRL
ncbi:MAG: carbohydrate porin [Stellaceae bacterium]